MIYTEIYGNLITLAQEGTFDVIAHGCNCFCTMGAGIAPQMAKAFDCDKYELEADEYRGDINKLGQIQYHDFMLTTSPKVSVVNCYSQYDFRGTKPFDEEAFTLCMRKINKQFAGKHVGLPQIGAGLAGGNWETIKSIIVRELFQTHTTVVIFRKD